MPEKSDYYALPPAIDRFSGNLRVVGWVSFWAQLVLAIISSIVLLFAGLFGFTSGPGGGANNPGTGGGLFFAICGLIALYYSVYQAFRFTRLARQLRSPTPSLRPRRVDTIQVLRFALVASIVGMSLTLIGAGAINGTLVAKALRQPRGIFNPSVNIEDFIQPIDLFIVQANTNTILAHFIGIVAILWLLNAIHKASQS
ncbi:MAG: DUF3611 family protein [Desertifilum sp. SIO1I2]|nr:DUF3611 family protein [Desertifilum sp. SIO1I2]